jgi:hypothetical protein
VGEPALDKPNDGDAMEKSSRVDSSDDVVVDESTLPSACPSIADNLPDEILLLIAERCNLPDLGRLACVSRSWNRVSSDAALMARAYTRHLPPCASAHRCRAVVTDAICNPAFFIGGLAALGVPTASADPVAPDGDDDGDDDDTSASMSIDDAHDSAAALQGAEDSRIRRQPHRADRKHPTSRDHFTSDDLPDRVPLWALEIGRALAECCARLARSSGDAYASASVEARDALAKAEPCRHVPPSLSEAFGVGAAYRVAVADGSPPGCDGLTFTAEPSPRPEMRYRSRCLFGHLRGVYQWPAPLETPGAHRAVLFTDGHSYANASDEVSLVLTLADADGSTVWALASTTCNATREVSADNVDWCCVGPFGPRAPTLAAIVTAYGPTRASTRVADQPTSSLPQPKTHTLSSDVDQSTLAATGYRPALFTAQRTDGAIMCMPTTRVPTFMSTVRGLLHSTSGPCIMRSRGSDACYSGHVARGMRGGHGTARYADGTVLYEGAWEDDLPKGDGTLYARDGTVVFSGVFDRGVPNGPGTLTVPVSSGSVRPCKVWAPEWIHTIANRTHWTTPYGQGHIRLADGTRLDCRWSRSGRPPLVMRVHIPPMSVLYRPGTPSVLDLGSAPPRLFYDEALDLLENDRLADDAPPPDASDATFVRARRGGVQATAVDVDRRQRRDARSKWTTRVGASFVASQLMSWMGELTPKPDDWITRTLAHPALCFAVDIAPHSSSPLVVDLLGL